MNRKHIAAVLALGAFAVTPILFSSPEDTSAAWRETNSASPGNAQFGGIQMTAVDVTPPVTATTVPITTPGTMYQTANTPAITVKNNSAQHRAWIDVVSVKVDGDYNNNTNASYVNLLADLDVDYDISANPTCDSGLDSASLYWNINGSGVGGLSTGSTYTRGGSDPTTLISDDIAPGATRYLCPWLRPVFATNTQNGRRDMLLNWAGRNVTVTTVLRLKSYSKGTWTSNTQTITSVYQVRIPPIVKRDNGSVCGTYFQYGEIYYAWPTNADYGSLTTNAMGRWYVMRRNPSTGVWAPFRKSVSQTPGTEINYSNSSDRYVGSLNSNNVNNDDGNSSTKGATVQFMIRGYLSSTNFTNPTGPYINSDFIVQAYEQNDTWVCAGSLANTNVGNADSPGYHAS